MINSLMLFQDLNHNAVGWLDWNLCLNSVGGPNWAKNYVDSAIIVVPEKNLFLKVRTSIYIYFFKRLQIRTADFINI